MRASQGAALAPGASRATSHTSSTAKVATPAHSSRRMPGVEALAKDAASRHPSLEGCLEPRHSVSLGGTRRHFEHLACQSHACLAEVRSWTQEAQRAGVDRERAEAQREHASSNRQVGADESGEVLHCSARDGSLQDLLNLDSSRSKQPSAVFLSSLGRTPVGPSPSAGRALTRARGQPGP